MSFGLESQLTLRLENPNLVGTVRKVRYSDIVSAGANKIYNQSICIASYLFEPQLMDIPPSIIVGGRNGSLL